MLLAGMKPAKPAQTFAPPEPQLRDGSSLFWLPTVLTFALAAFAFLPPARDNERLAWSLLGVAGALLVWQVVLWLIGRSRGMRFEHSFSAVRSHYVQAMVQCSILLYWGWYWRNVYAELPLIIAQLVFLYVLDASLSWSRGRTWRVGFGPFPIVISTNLLLWFKHDWYFLQFVMLTIGALGKQFITWERDGKRTHIFNPSAFGQSVVAIVLIAAGLTNELTWGREIASQFEVPHMLIVIFLGGLVVQFLFHVTLMTFAAVATLYVLNLIYTQMTGLYFFVNINIAAPIFLGVHLLMTDPATSPRTNLGRIVFGSLYGMGYLALFRLFDVIEVPLFWDKLLPVPVLNLLVPWIDRVMRHGVLGRLNAAWQKMLPAAPLNMLHMTLWGAFFGSMLLTGFIESSHPGNSIEFWKQAYLAGRHHAGHGYVMVVGSYAEGGHSPPAINELGVICMQGEIVNPNPARGAEFFARACAMGDVLGCENLVIQHLFMRQTLREQDVVAALNTIEQRCMQGGADDWLACYLLGVAYETGRGRPQNASLAIQQYLRCGRGNLYAIRGIARIALANPRIDVRHVVPLLSAAAAQGDAESAWYLAYMFHGGVGVERDDQQARTLLKRACDLGSADACKALAQAELPPYVKPIMNVPGWLTAYPVQPPTPSDAATRMTQR